MGLIGTGGVHALDKHLLAAVELGRRAGLKVAIHAWLDGRDTPPQSGLEFMEEGRSPGHRHTRFGVLRLSGARNWDMEVR